MDSVMKGLMGAMLPPRVFGLEPPLLTALDGCWTDGRISCRHSAPTSFLVANLLLSMAETEF